jgi:hypothetical protein
MPAAKKPAFLIPGVNMRGSAFDLTKAQAKFINKHTDMKVQEKY